MTSLPHDPPGRWFGGNPSPQSLHELHEPPAGAPPWPPRASPLQRRVSSVRGSLSGSGGDADSSELQESSFEDGASLLSSSWGAGARAHGHRQLLQARSAPEAAGCLSMSSEEARKQRRETLHRLYSESAAGLSDDDEAADDQETESEDFGSLISTPYSPRSKALSIVGAAAAIALSDTVSATAADESSFGDELDMDMDDAWAEEQKRNATAAPGLRLSGVETEDDEEDDDGSDSSHSSYRPSESQLRSRGAALKPSSSPAVAARLSTSAPAAPMKPRASRSQSKIAGAAKAAADEPEGPLRCECGATFERRHDLLRHQRTAAPHIAGKVWECPHCNKGFSRNDAVTRHLNDGRCNVYKTRGKLPRGYVSKSAVRQ